MKSSFKRWFSIVLAIVVLSTMLTVPAMASAVNKGAMVADALPEITTLFDENFNRDNETVTANTTRFDADNTNSLVVSARGATISDNKLITVNPGSGTYSSIVAQQGAGLEKYTGTYVVDFDFMQPTAGRIDTLYSHQQLRASDGKNYVYPLAKIAASSLDASKFVVYAGAIETTFSPVNGQWHNFKAVIHYDDSTWDLFIDGTMFAYRANFQPADNTYIFDLDDGAETATIRPFISNYAFAETHYDNIKIYRAPEDRRIYAADSVEGYTGDITFNQDNKRIVRFAGLPIITSSTNQPKNFNIDSTNDRFNVAAGAVVMANPNNPLITDKKIAFQATVTLPEQTSYGILYFTTNNGANHAAAQVYATQTQICVQAYGSSGIPIVDNYEANTPYTITLYMDLDKSFIRELDLAADTVDDNADGFTTAHGMFDVYVNNVCVATNVKMHYHSNISTDLQDFGRLICVQNPSAPFYLDDILIYSDPREAVLSTAAAAFNEAYPGGSISADEFALPSSSDPNYTLTWSSDSPAFSVSETTCTVNQKNVTGYLTATIADVNNQYSVSRKFEVKYEKFTLTESGVYVPKTYAGAKLIMVSYAGENLIDIKAFDVTADGIEKTIAETELSVANADTIRAFLWNNLEELVPVAGDEKARLGE